MHDFDNPNFYKYRKLTYKIAVVYTFLTLFVPEFFKVYGTVLMYPVLSVLGDIVFYKILRKKESETLPEEILQSTFNITGQELDAYAVKMSKVRLTALLLALTIFAVIYTIGYKWCDLLAFALTYIGINATAWLHARYSKNIKQPVWRFKVEPYELPSMLDDRINPANAAGYTNPSSPLNPSRNC